MDFRLETLLDAATDGKKAETDWTAVKTFCSYIRRDEDRTGYVQYNIITKLWAAVPC